ncbi:MAG: tRNA threonylcarbamoyladenosine dehydratase [Bacteroidetes bacterium]|nr:MAG: tRNA threonylcarbamoyladenosine dehydratase [Bacteroidota bacterium]
MLWQERTELLIGDKGLSQLKKAHVIVVGLGGVGAYAAEQLARAGVGKLTIVDGDTIHPSNRNRQLLALKSTEGKAKAELMKKRLLDINPDIEINAIQEYIKGERLDKIIAQKYDYVVDAIDTLAPKVFLINQSLKSGNKLISSMGAGGKTNPSKVQITDFSKTYNDKLARYLRKRLHRLGIYDGFKVVFSSEQINPNSSIPVEGEANKKTTVGTISYMPAIFGIFMASIVIRDLLEITEKADLLINSVASHS